MDRFLIETPHREQDCLNLIQLLHAQGYLTHFKLGLHEWRAYRLGRD